MVLVRCVPVSIMKRQFLLGEHNETGIIYNSIIRDRVLTMLFPSFYSFLKSKGIRVGWINHPQTLRFKEHIGMLIDRHRQQVEEMKARGYHHNSPLIGEEFFKLEEYNYSEEEYERDYAILSSREGVRAVS